MNISLIVAMSKNRVIGKNGALSWYIPEDLKLFKTHTLGKTLIMGRKTYESIGFLLPNRKTIILTSDSKYHIDGAYIAHSMKEAIEIAESIGLDVFVCGGAKVYEEALQFVDKMYISQLHNEVDGDTFFPMFDGFKIAETTPYQNFDFLVYERA